MTVFQHGHDKPRFRIDSRQDLLQAIVLMQQMGAEAAHRIPVLRALYHGAIAYMDVDGDTPSRAVKMFIRASHPASMVIIADDGYTPVGPAGIATTERLMRWARQIIIHGTGPHPDHYRGAVLATGIFGRLVLVECPSSLIADYVAAAKRWGQSATVQIVQPPDGAQHPDLSQREPLQ